MKWTKLPPTSSKEGPAYFIEGDDSELTIDKHPKKNIYTIFNGKTGPYETLRAACTAYLILRSVRLYQPKE